MKTTMTRRLLLAKVREIAEAGGVKDPCVGGGKFCLGCLAAQAGNELSAVVEESHVSLDRGLSADAVAGVIAGVINRAVAGKDTYEEEHRLVEQTKFHLKSCKRRVMRTGGEPEKEFIRRVIEQATAEQEMREQEPERLDHAQVRQWRWEMSLDDKGKSRCLPDFLLFVRYFLGKGGPECPKPKPGSEFDDADLAEIHAVLKHTDRVWQGTSVPRFSPANRIDNGLRDMVTGVMELVREEQESRRLAKKTEAARGE